MTAVPTVEPSPLRLEGMMDLVPLSINQYQRMIAAGILTDGAPIELIEGYLVAKDRGRGPGMPHAEPHASAVRNLNELLIQTLTPSWVVQCQLPIALGPVDEPGGSAPEPDVTVAIGPRRRYTDHHPRPKEIRLVVEVADSTLAFDRRVKARLYAGAGISNYWIVNLIDRQLEVYTRPEAAGQRYRSRKVLAEDESVVLRWAKLAPITFPVRDFLP